MLGDGDSGAAAPRPTKAAVAEAEKKVRGERAGDALEAARAVAVERGLSREAAAAAAGTRELRELLRRLPKTTYLDECAVLNAHSLVVRGGVEEDWQGRISKERARAMAFNRACWEKQEENNNRQRSKREVLRIMRLYRTIDEWSSPSGNSKSKGTSCTGQQTPTSGTPPVLPPPPAHAGSACSCSEHVEHLAQSAPSDHARAGTECEDTIIAEIQHLLDGVHDEGGEDYNEAEEDANWAKLGELVRRLGLDLDSLEQLTEDELGGDEDPLRLRGGAPPFEQDRKRKAPDAAAGKNNDSEPGENAVKGARSPNARQPPSGQEHLGESSAEANKKPRKGKSKADATPHALADHPLLTRTPTAPKKGKAKQPKDDGAVSGSGQPQVGQGVLGQADTEQPLWVTGDPFNLPDREQRLTAAREETQRRQAQQLVRKFGLKDLDPEVAQVDPLSIKPTETILKEAKAAVLLQYPKTLAWIERDDGGEEGRRQRSKIFGRSVIKQLLKLYILVAMNRKHGRPPLERPKCSRPGCPATLVDIGHGTAPHDGNLDPTNKLGNAAALCHSGTVDDRQTLIADVNTSDSDFVCVHCNRTAPDTSCGVAAQLFRDRVEELGGDVEAAIAEKDPFVAQAMRYKVVTGCQFEACPWNGKGTDGGHVVPAEMDMGSQPEEDESPWGKHGQGLYDGLGGGVEEEEQEVDQGAEDAWEACLAKLGRERRAQADGARMGDDLFEEGEESGDQDAGSGDDVKVKPPLGLVTSERGSFRPTHEFMAREFPQFPSFPFFQDGSGRIGALKNASKFTMACSGQLRRYADQPDKIERLLNLQLQVFSTRYVFHKFGCSSITKVEYWDVISKIDVVEVFEGRAVLSEDGKFRNGSRHIDCKTCCLYCSETRKADGIVCGYCRNYPSGNVCRLAYLADKLGEEYALKFYRGEIFRHHGTGATVKCGRRCCTCVGLPPGGQCPPCSEVDAKGNRKGSIDRCMIKKSMEEARAGEIPTETEVDIPFFWTVILRELNIAAEFRTKRNEQKDSQDDYVRDDAGNVIRMWHMLQADRNVPHRRLRCPCCFCQGFSIAGSKKAGCVPCQSERSQERERCKFVKAKGAAPTEWLFEYAKEQAALAADDA